MRVRKEVGYMVLAVVTVCVILSSIGFAWMYFSVQPVVADQKIRSELLRLQAAAQLYYFRIETYRGVCRDIGVRTSYVCNETEEAYAISVEMTDGNFLCVDNSGHIGEQVVPVKAKPKCNKQ